MLKKISLSILIMLTFVLTSHNNQQAMRQMLLSQQNKMNNIDKTKISEEMIVKENADKILQDANEDSCRKLYVMLNNEEFYQKFIETPKAGITESELKNITETSQDVFLKNDYSSDIFPVSLVNKLQEILYNSCVNNIGDAEFSDNKLLDKLAGEKNELTKEESVAIFQEEAEYYDGIYQFFLDNNREAYLFRFDMGGTEREYYITIKVKSGKELNEITSFGTPYHNGGTVIKYQKNYYYVFFQQNYNLKCDDGIRIHRLSENAREENILIRYIPNEYTWKNLYKTDDRLIKEYVENMQDMLTSEEYIERGAQKNYYNMIMGDETEDIDFPLTEENKKYYKIDFTNTGIPIYIYRTTYEPSNAYNKISLKFSFYLYNDEKNEILELNALSFNNEGSKTANGLLQMWFKKFNEKVYTFQIYSMDNFRYMLNVFLVEGDKITPVRVDYILPKRTIVIED